MSDQQAFITTQRTPLRTRNISPSAVALTSLAVPEASSKIKLPSALPWPEKCTMSGL